jgi:hypothetical protein
MACEEVRCGRHTYKTERREERSWVSPELVRRCGSSVIGSLMSIVCIVDMFGRLDTTQEPIFPPLSMHGCVHVCMSTV